MPASNASSDGFDRSPLHGENEEEKPAAADSELPEPVLPAGDAALGGGAAPVVSKPAEHSAPPEEPRRQDPPAIQVGPGPNTGSTAGYERCPLAPPRGRLLLSCDLLIGHDVFFCSMSTVSTRKASAEANLSRPCN